MVEPLSEKKTCASPAGVISIKLARQLFGRLVREAGKDDLVELVGLRLGSPRTIADGDGRA